MKKLLFALAFLIGYVATIRAQSPTYQQINGHYQNQWNKTDSAQIIPRYHTVGRPAPTPAGFIIYNIDSVKLQYADGSNWHSVDGLLSGSVGATNINVGSGYRIGIAVTTNIKTLNSSYGLILDSATANELHFTVDSSKLATTFKLSLKINIADTAAMLAPYLRKTDTTLMLSVYLRKSDTTAMLLPYLRKSDTAISFARFVKYADTSSMLTVYLRKSDTTAMLSKYLRKSDTTGMLLPYLRKVDTAAMLTPYAKSALVVKYTDTASMLSVYLRRSDTTAMLSKYLRKSDTTAMLSVYLRKSDTTAMLVKYLRRSDTTAMLTPYLRKADTAAMLTPYAKNILVVKYTDTSNLLLPYLRRSDTTAMLSKYLRRSDTTAMLSVYLRKSDTTGMLSPYLRSSVAAATYATITSLNNKVDSIKRAPGNDSVFYWHSGTKVFAFLDSAGGPGGGAIASINGLTNSSIVLVTGTTPGTDFNISTTAPGTIRFIIPSSSAANRGLLTAADWSTFNAKQNALSIGSLTESTSSVLTITGGTGAVIGSGATIQVKQASNTQSGFLSAADWNTFNSKGAGITSVTGTYPVTVANGTTAPIVSIDVSGLPNGFFKNGLHARNDSTVVLGGSLDSAIKFSGHNSFAMAFDSTQVNLTGTSKLNINPTGIAVSTEVDGLILENKTPVNGGNLYEYSPATKFIGHAFASSTDNTVQWRNYVKTGAAGMSYSGDLVWERSVDNGATWAEIMRLGSNVTALTTPLEILVGSGGNVTTITGGTMSTQALGATGTISLTNTDLSATGNITTPVTTFTANTFTATLPLISSTANAFYYLTNIGTGTVTISTQGSQNITNGSVSATTWTLTQGKYLTIYASFTGSIGHYVVLASN